MSTNKSSNTITLPRNFVTKLEAFFTSRANTITKNKNKFNQETQEELAKIKNVLAVLKQNKNVTPISSNKQVGQQNGIPEIPKIPNNPLKVLNGSSPKGTGPEGTGLGTDPKGTGSEGTDPKGTGSEGTGLGTDPKGPGSEGPGSEGPGSEGPGSVPELGGGGKKRVSKKKKGTKKSTQKDKKKKSTKKRVSKK